MHPEKMSVEVGHIYYRITLKIKGSDDKFEEMEREMKPVYFEPFEKDAANIHENLKKIVILNEDRQAKLEKQYEKVDKITTSLRETRLEKQKLEYVKNKLLAENDHLKNSMAKLENFDELHIEVDMLSQSEQGVDLLRRRYAELLNQVSLQRQWKTEKDQEYYKIDGVLTKIDIVKKKKEKVEDANKQLKFNIERQKDMLPLLQTYMERNKNNTNIIENLREQIKIKIDENPGDLNKIQGEIAKLYKEKKKFEEKEQQLKLYSTIYATPDGSDEDKSSTLAQIIGYDEEMKKMYVERELHYKKEYLKKIEEMTGQRDELQTRLDGIVNKEIDEKSRHILVDPKIKKTKYNYIVHLEMLERRETTIKEEIENEHEYYNDMRLKLTDRMKYLDRLINTLMNKEKEREDLRRKRQQKMADLYKNELDEGYEYEDL